MPKRILYVRSGPFELNVNSYNVQELGLGKAFCRLGYDFDFVTFKKENFKEWVFFEQNGCKAKCIEMPRFRLFRWGINMSICTKSFLKQYDYVIGSEYMQIMTFLLSRNADKMFIYNGPYYNLFMFKCFSPIYDLLFTNRIKMNTEHIFAKSNLAKNFLESKTYKNVTTVGVGLDTERFEKEIPVCDETQKLIDYMRNNDCILYVGSLSERKNFPFLLEVYKKILEKRKNTKFVIIGKSVINPYMKLIGKKDSDYERMCLEKFDESVKSGIYRLQKIDNTQLKYIYPLAKAFLLPSKQEIFGMVLLEAMYFGAPIVTSSNGGSETLIRERNSGQIVDFNEDDWATAVLKYLENEPFAKAVCLEAHRIVAEEYNWNMIAKKMSAFFN